MSSDVEIPKLATRKFRILIFCLIQKKNGNDGQHRQSNNLFPACLWPQQQIIL